MILKLKLKQLSSSRSSSSRNAFILLLSFTFLIETIKLLNVQLFVLAAIGECNFEKYATGCYSQANFICDPNTNQCKCHPELPILIDQRICVKRLKENEICHYNEQCDNLKGIYCLHSDFKLVNSSSSSAATAAFNSIIKQTPQATNLLQAPSNTLNNHDSNKDLIRAQLNQLTAPTTSSHSLNPRCRNIKLAKHRQKQSTGSIPAFAQTASSNKDKQNLISSPYIPRVFWLFLIVCLIGLLLLMMQYYKIDKTYQNYRHQYNQQQNHHHNQHQNQRQQQSQQQQIIDQDNVSIDCEFDVPPPYEIAIRMKM